jgi:hypothetical protein
MNPFSHDANLTTRSALEVSMSEEVWPALPWKEWEPTATTLHMWTQIVGKTRLTLFPLQAHWWNVTLYISPCGLTTAAMPMEDGNLEIEFDFLAHGLHFRLSDGRTKTMKLRPRSVADFYREYLETLRELGVQVKINPMPCELKEPIRFDEDTVHASYDPEYVQRFWRILLRTSTIFQRFSSEFLGKVSPAHFFWGSFDLAVTRFSGRIAPDRPGADAIQREAYSHEVISAGFWPGNGGFGEAAFYAYAAPSPEGLDRVKIGPASAYFDKTLGEFILKYDDLRRETSPDDALMEFLQSTYAAAADAAKWDRKALERLAA